MSEAVALPVRSSTNVDLTGYSALVMDWRSNNPLES